VKTEQKMYKNSEQRALEIIKLKLNSWSYNVLN